MQKVLRATDRAKTQARRKVLALREKNNSVDRSMLAEQKSLLQKEVNSDIYMARKARQEDWLLGPLAPRRDAGGSKDTYGTVGLRRLNGVDKAGKFHDYCIAEGDRVVVVGKGMRDQGKIGVVKDVKVKAEECTVEGFNLVDIATPEYILEAETDKRPTRTTEAPIPLSVVRLVHPLPNAETGSMRDVIIKELRRSSNSERKLGFGGRYVAGTDPKIYIPLPEKPTGEQPEYDIDSLRIEVEEKTWTPTLFQPPMPESVIDELRNKYSIFRDRHDESHVRAREDRAAELEEAGREKEEAMLTPLDEYHRMKKMEKTQIEEKPLEREVLTKIGEVMARNKLELRHEAELSVQPRRIV